MQADFHYYAAYCAAYLAGFSHGESLAIAYSDQFTDCCTKSYLNHIHGPYAAATTQVPAELMDVNTDILGLQDITRIWASFHFLPYDLYAETPKACREYRDKFRLLCGPNGDLVEDTVERAKGRGLQAAGLAMHAVSDTWAHMYFAGTPSLVMNNITSYFFEETPEGERRVHFVHSPRQRDDPETGQYLNSVSASSENSVANLGHGRAGHLPDYSYARYRYLPAWGGCREIVKDNPSDYLHAFAQMVRALRYLRGDLPEFHKGEYDWGITDPYKDKIVDILSVRRIDASADWKAFGESLSGHPIPDFSTETYEQEYLHTPQEEKNQTFLGRFFLAALGQKSMVTNKIWASGNLLAGKSVEYDGKAFHGIRDYARLISERIENTDLHDLFGGQ